VRSEPLHLYLELLSVDLDKPISDILAEAISEFLLEAILRALAKQEIPCRKLRSTLTKNKHSEKQETPASLRSDEPGHFPSEHMDGYPRDPWTLSPEYAIRRLFFEVLPFPSFALLRHPGMTRSKAGCCNPDCTASRDSFRFSPVSMIKFLSEDRIT
jgi:hypothetical protein